MGLIVLIRGDGFLAEKGAENDAQKTGAVAKEATRWTTTLPSKDHFPDEINFKPVSGTDLIT